MGSDETEDTPADELDALVRELRHVLGTTPDEAFTRAADAAPAGNVGGDDDEDTDDE